MKMMNFVRSKRTPFKKENTKIIKKFEKNILAFALNSIISMYELGRVNN
jgi:hypothetical protein